MVTRNERTAALHPQVPEPPQPGRSFRPGEQIFELNDDTDNRAFAAEKANQERAVEQLGKRILDNAAGAVPKPIGRST